MTQILVARLVGFNLDAGDLFRLERFSISCHLPKSCAATSCCVRTCAV